MAAFWRKIMFVEGNNEYRDAFLTDGNFNIADNEGQIRLLLSGIPNVVYLQDQPYIENGVAFIGRYGHWDHRADPRLTQEEGIQEQAKVFCSIMNKTDIHKPEIRDQLKKQGASPTSPFLTGEQAVAAARCIVRQAHEDFEGLRDEVISLNKNEAVHTIVLVTHTLPSAHLLSSPAGTTPWRNSIMANTELETLKQHDENDKLRHWVFGHQHKPVQKNEAGVLYVANPLGNPGEIYSANELRKYSTVSVDIDNPAVNLNRLRSSASKKNPTP